MDGLGLALCTRVGISRSPWCATVEGRIPRARRRRFVSVIERSCLFDNVPYFRERYACKALSIALFLDNFAAEDSGGSFVNSKESHSIKNGVCQCIRNKQSYQLDAMILDNMHARCPWRALAGRSVNAAGYRGMNIDVGNMAWRTTSRKSVN